MKHADKNEVDILLRSLAKRSQLATAVDAAAEGDHLDVDEVSSYAEDALPSAARARYTAHIADCANCRKLVSNLTLSAGDPAREAKDPEPAKSFWQKLAPFFSPAVLRYAAPALALTAIIVVGLIALRQPGSSDLARQTAPLNEPTTPGNEAVAEKFGSPVLDDKLQTKPYKGDDAEAVVIPKEESARSNESVAAVGNKDQPAKTADSSEVAAQPTYAPEPATAPPPAPKAAEEKQSEAEKPKETESRIQTDEQKTRDVIAKNDRAAAGGITARKLENLPAASRRAGVRKDESASTDKKKAATEEETRSVAGRRFRREGNSWIDTAYNQGASVVKVNRGSEQFRALVADEPGLKTVSEELSGSVIVVWKGRAYRIE